MIVDIKGVDVLRASWTAPYHCNVASLLYHYRVSNNTHGTSGKGGMVQLTAIDELLHRIPCTGMFLLHVFYLRVTENITSGILYRHKFIHVFSERWVLIMHGTYFFGWGPFFEDIALFTLGYH